MQFGFFFFSFQAGWKNSGKKHFPVGKWGFTNFPAGKFKHYLCLPELPWCLLP